MKKNETGLIKKLSFLALLMIFSVSVSSTIYGQLSLNNTTTSRTIDFSTTIAGVNNGAYTGSGFQPTPTAGQLDSDAFASTGMSDGNLAFGGTAVTGDYARGAVSTAQATGGFYAYTGTPGSVANPSFLFQPIAADFTPGTLMLRIQNNGTTNITQIAVSYDLFFRNDQAFSNSLNFSYSTDNITYTPVGALDFATPAAADTNGYVQVGTSPSRSTTITGLTITPGSFFYIRFSSDDVSGSGSRDEIAIDNISVTATFDVVSAAGATINGRITDQRGRGLKHIVVMLAGGALEEPIYATTSAFGYYRFEDVPAGNTYILTAFSKNYVFDQSSLVINLNNDFSDADFVGHLRFSGLK